MNRVGAVVRLKGVEHEWVKEVCYCSLRPYTRGRQIGLHLT